jgi:hypothetical protein
VRVRVAAVCLACADYQPRDEEGACGDTSPGFNFAALFPLPLQPPLRVIGHATYIVVSGTGAFPPVGWGKHEGISGDDVEMGVRGGVGGGAGGGAADGDALLGACDAVASAVELLRTPLPATSAVTTTDPEVAERRREKARLLIEARLAAKDGAHASGAGAGAAACAAADDAAGTPTVLATPPPAQAPTTPATPALGAALRGA